MGRASALLLLGFAGCAIERASWTPPPRPPAEVLTAPELHNQCVDLDDPADELEWCIRLSPEEPEEHSADPGHSDGLDPRQCEGLRCAVLNLLGAFSVHGPAATPVLTYCDEGMDGGMRVVRILPERPELERHALAPQMCAASPQGGGMAALSSGGHVAAWIEHYGGTDTVSTALVDADGRPSQSPRRHVLLDGARLVEVAAGPAGALLAHRDQAGVLSATSLDAASAVVGSPVMLAQGVLAFGLAALGDGFAVGACSEELEVVLVAADSALPVERWTVPGAACDAWSRVGMASHGDTLALAWQGQGSGALAIARDGRILARHPAASLATVAATPDGFVALDATGLLQVVDLDGRLLETRHHPHVRLGHVDALELRVEGPSDVLLAVAGMGYRRQDDHLFEWGTLEVSRMVLEPLR